MTLFNEYLRRVREQRGISQEALAVEAGISSAYISQLENGRRNPPAPDILRRLAIPLDVPYLVLMSHAGYLRSEELQILLLQAIKTLFATEPGRSVLISISQGSLERWDKMNEVEREQLLQETEAENISDLLLEAMLQCQADLLWADLFEKI